MAWRFVKQPDGKLARFSDVVDNFTHYDLSPDEAIQVCIDEYDFGPKGAQIKVQAGVDDDCCNGWVDHVADDGLNRWRDSIQTVASVHGHDELRAAMTEMGQDVAWADLVQTEKFYDANGEKTGGNVWLTRASP